MLVVAKATAAVAAVSGIAGTIAENGPAALLWLAGSITALGVLWRVMRPGWRKTREFSRSWFGEPAAPGVAARPGLPETVAQMAAHLHEIKTGLDHLTVSSKDNGDKIDLLDQRVSDHRRRNEETARILREELVARAVALEAKLQARNDVVDARLAGISDDLLRAETMRAALAELGIDVDLPKKP